MMIMTGEKEETSSDESEMIMTAEMNDAEILGKTAIGRVFGHEKFGTTAGTIAIVARCMDETSTNREGESDLVLHVTRWVIRLNA